MPQTIAITPAALRNEDNDITRALKEAGYRVLTHPKMVPPTPDEQLELLKEAAGIILGPEELPARILQQAPHLRVVSRFGVGYDNIDLAACTELGIVATFVPDAMVEAVADITFGLLLAAARRIPELDGLLKAGEWKRLAAAAVSGQTIGIVGTGRIGLAVARRAKAFRMRLVGHDPYPNAAFTEELGGEYVPLDELLAVSDFVSLHMPATPDTRGLFDAARFAQMKPTAFFINAARGTLVDEAALIEALDAGQLAGAGTDVFAQEPPAPGSTSMRLAQHPKVIGTPHVASMTPLTVAKMAQAAHANLVAVLNGQRPECLCNPEVYQRGLRS